jgi:hypothetical protein
MRQVFALVSLFVLLGGCVPEIPVRPEFGVSALNPVGNIPPEFAAFNNYEPGTNRLLANQICATPYILEVEHTARAVPGEIIGATGRCETYALQLADPNAPAAP